MARWINVELAEVSIARLDLLGETDTAELVHFELQSTNDPNMPLRMAEYALAIYKQFRRFAWQFVLYVGEPKLRMSPKLLGPNVLFRYELVDIRQINGNELLHSHALGSNILAILGQVNNPQQTAREVLVRIAQSPPEQRAVALSQFMLISGLRGLENFVKKEAQRMPILTDILDHKVIGPAFNDGRLSIIRRQITHCFGQIPDWVEARLQTLSRDEIEPLADRILDAQRLQDLFEPQ